MIHIFLQPIDLGAPRGAADYSARMIITSLVAGGRSDWVLGKNLFSGGGEEWYRSALPIPLCHPAPHLPHFAADWRSCAWPTGGAALSLSVCSPPFPSLSRSATKRQRSCLATRANQQVIAPVWRDRWPRSANHHQLGRLSSGIWFRLRNTAAKNFFFLPLSSSFSFSFYSMSLWRLCGDIINAFWTKSLPAV